VQSFEHMQHKLARAVCTEVEAAMLKHNEHEQGRRNRHRSPYYDRCSSCVYQSNGPPYFDMPVLKCLACTERNVRQEVEGKIEREEQEAVAQIEAEFQPLLVALTESWEAAMRSAVLAVARVCAGPTKPATGGGDDETTPDQAVCGSGKQWQAMMVRWAEIDSLLAAKAEKIQKIEAVHSDAAAKKRAAQPEIKKLAHAAKEKCDAEMANADREFAPGTSATYCHVGPDGHRYNFSPQDCALIHQAKMRCDGCLHYHDPDSIWMHILNIYIDHLVVLPLTASDCL
jgi:hypothetical protein